MNALEKINPNMQVEYKSNNNNVVLNFDLVRSVLAVGNNINNNEIYAFIKMCEFQRLNPFLKEAHLVKYGDTAQLIVGIDVFTDRLNENPSCEGWSAGTICQNEKGEIINHDGPFYVSGKEKVIGAWFEAHKKGWKKPFLWSVTLAEYYREYYDKKAGRMKALPQWASMPAIMIVKCAIASGARKFSSKDFGGMYAPEEVGVQVQNGNVIDITPEPEELISIDDMKKIKQSATSKMADIDSGKLIKFIMGKLVKDKILSSNKLNDIPVTKLDLVIKAVQSAVLAKEKKVAKEDPLPTKEEPKKDDLLDGLPSSDDNFAKPVEEVKKTNDNTNNKINKEIKK